MTDSGSIHTDREAEFQPDTTSEDLSSVDRDSDDIEVTPISDESEDRENLDDVDSVEDDSEEDDSEEEPSGEQKPESEPTEKPAESESKPPKEKSLIVSNNAEEEVPGNIHLPVELDVFTGPLDLLVNLIATHELDIQQVPIAEITSAYLDLIRSWEEKNLDLAGEYLVLASTLIRYKSRSMLPREEQLEEEEEPISDDELLQRQLDYERFRQAAMDLRDRREFADRLVARQGPSAEKGQDVIEYGEVSVYDLYETFRRIIADLGDTEIPTIVDENYSVDEKMIELESFLNTVGKLHLPSYLRTMRSKLEIIVVFLALLELMRLRVIKATQERMYEDIWIIRHPDAPEPTDYGDGLLPEVSPAMPEPAPEATDSQSTETESPS